MRIPVLQTSVSAIEMAVKREGRKSYASHSNKNCQNVVQQRTIAFASCLVEDSYKCLLYLCLCLYTKWAREESFFVDKLTFHI